MRIVILARCLLVSLLCLTPVPAPCESLAPSTPEVIELGAPLSAPSSLDVDQYGRLYILDRSREAVMRFGADGVLEQLWPEGFGDATFYNNRQELRVSASGIMFLGFGGTGHETARRIWPDMGEDKTFPRDNMSVLCVAGLSDGSFFVRGTPWEFDKRPYSDTIRAYAPDGAERARWYTPPIGAWTLGNDGLIYGAVRYQGLQYDGKPAPKPPPGEESLMLVYTTQGKLHHKIDLSSVLGKRALMWSLATRFAVDANGDIYLPNGGRIARLDNHGRLITQWPLYSDPNCPGRGGQLEDTAVRDGMVYLLVKTAVSRAAGSSEDGETHHGTDYSYEIQVFTPDGRCVVRYVPVRPQLDMPADIAVQSDGSYAAVERGYVDLLTFGPNGKCLGPLANHYAVQAVAARPSGGYYVSSWMSGGMGIDIVEADGKTVEHAYRAPERKAVEMPYRLAVDPTNGDLWGLNSWALFHFSPDAKLIERLAAFKTLNTCPILTGFAVDRDGFFYFTDVWRHCVVKLNIEFKEIMKFGSEGTGLGQLRGPQGLLVDAKGNLFVADTGNSRIQVFSPDGAPIGFWGHRGTGPGELDRPLAMAFGPNDTLWISDTHNDRIVRVALRDFWKQLQRKSKPEAAAVAPKLQRLPAAGKVSVTGIVIADSDDFTDLVYLESPDRAWAVSVTLPSGTRVKRGECWRIIGTLGSAKRLVVGETAQLEVRANGPGLRPVGMANLYVGDGFAPVEKPVGLTNECMLVKTWGRVVSVNLQDQSFTIEDGSLQAGLEVSARGLRTVFTEWPRVGQYVGVTGISVASETGPCIRIRGREDICIFAGN